MREGFDQSDEAPVMYAHDIPPRDEIRADGAIVRKDSPTFPDSLMFDCALVAAHVLETIEVKNRSRSDLTYNTIDYSP